MREETLLELMQSFKSDCEMSVHRAELEDLFRKSMSNISAEKYLYCQFSSGGPSFPTFARLKSSYGIRQEAIENYRLGIGGTIDSLIKFTLEQMKSFELQEYLKNEKNENFINGLFDSPKGYGLVLPVFGPNRNSGLFCIAFSADISKNTQLQNTLLQWACQLAHYRYLELDN